MHKLRNEGTGKLKNFIKACVPALILLILWQLAFCQKKWSTCVTSGTGKSVEVLCYNDGKRDVCKHVLVSFKRVLTGFSISFVCAFCLGMIIFKRKIWKIYYMVICGIYAQCAAHQFDRSFDPVVWDWRETSKIIIIVLASFFFFPCL